MDSRRSDKVVYSGSIPLLPTMKARLLTIILAILFYMALILIFYNMLGDAIYYLGGCFILAIVGLMVSIAISN